MKNTFAVKLKLYQSISYRLSSKQKLDKDPQATFYITVRMFVEADDANQALNNANNWISTQLSNVGEGFYSIESISIKPHYT